jgi:hypothetical protein
MHINLRINACFQWAFLASRDQVQELFALVTLVLGIYFSRNLHNTLENLI